MSAGLKNTFITSAAQISGGLTLIKIAETTLTGAAASVSFASIPTGYTTLHVEASAVKGAGDTYLIMTLNSDAGANYNQQKIFADNAAASASRTGGASFFRIVYGEGAATLGATISMTNNATTTKAITTTAGDHYHFQASSGMYNSTTEISTVTFALESGANFSAGTKFALYGSKA